MSLLECDQMGIERAEESMRERGIEEELEGERGRRDVRAHGDALGPREPAVCRSL